MAYKLYMAGTLMPITPSKVTVKINNQNKTMTLINGEEINILKAAGLSDVSFELVLPQVSYPFSNGGAQSAAYYLSLFERLKVSKTPFQFILNRQKPGGGMFHYTNLTVGLETYEITDDAGEGFDVKVKINLKQYRAYGTKTVTVQPAKTSGGTATATVKAAPRPTTTAPKAATYTVKSGDCLWNIAKKQLGNGADYTKIYNLNKDKIKNPNLIYPGQVVTYNGGGSVATGSNAPPATRTVTVRSGDTLSGIAARLGIGYTQLTGYRSGNPNVIYPGEVLHY